MIFQHPVGNQKPRPQNPKADTRNGNPKHESRSRRPPPVSRTAYQDGYLPFCSRHLQRNSKPETNLNPRPETPEPKTLSLNPKTLNHKTRTPLCRALHSLQGSGRGSACQSRYTLRRRPLRHLESWSRFAIVEFELCSRGRPISGPHYRSPERNCIIFD